MSECHRSAAAVKVVQVLEQLDRSAVKEFLSGFGTLNQAWLMSGNSGYVNELTVKHVEALMFAGATVTFDTFLPFYQYNVLRITCCSLFY